MPSATAEGLPCPQEGMQAKPESLVGKEGTAGLPREPAAGGNDSVISTRTVEQNELVRSDLPKSPQGKRMPNESNSSEAAEKTGESVSACGKDRAFIGASRD
jgi:hypothetical protein